MTMKETIKLKAHDKAMAQIHANQLRIRQLEYDIERKNTGVVTMHELELCLDAAKREIATWNYILRRRDSRLTELENLLYLTK